MINWTSTVLVIGLLTYGMIHFPSAPIHPCGLEYCGKYGTKVAPEVYEAFIIWERSLIIFTAVSALLSLVGWLLKKFGKP